MGPIVTLTTDFGTADGYAGAMKGVLLSICPDCSVVDLTHDIPPQDLVAGALALEAAAPWFPRGSIHVGVVDPGVGSDRQAVAIRTTDFLLVGPDNGLFELVLRLYPALEVIELDPENVCRGRLSPTFHGRDIFAPAAGLLASGMPVTELGQPTRLRGRLGIPEPVCEGPSIRGQVIHSDRFGNLVTNLHESNLVGRIRSVRLVRPDCGDLTLPLARTYGDAAPGQPLAYFGSGCRIEIGVNGGAAIRELGAEIGAKVVVEIVT